MDIEDEAVRALGARHKDVVALTRASRLVAARLNGSDHRGMIPGDECPRCYEIRVLGGESDPAPIWFNECGAHRSDWEERQSEFIGHLIDRLEIARSTPLMTEAPQYRRRLAKASREWRKVTGYSFIKGVA